MQGQDNAERQNPTDTSTDHSTQDSTHAVTVKEVADVIINAVNLHHLPPGSITAETSLREGGLELDSIDILEVVVAIEHHFGIKVGDAEVAKEHFRSIGKIAAYAQSLRSAK